jgi:hypothetical protein
MSLPEQLAKHAREIHFGGNWTWSNVKDNLADVTWQQAITKVDSMNTIATLVFHVNYFVEAVIKVLEGGPLTAKDKFSFDHPPINSEADWKNLVNKTLTDAERFAELVSQLPESKLWEIFSEEKYGTYFRNIQGIIEHSHYHLGQIVIVKKLVSKV